MIIADFTTGDRKAGNWEIVNDVVMGGRSQSRFSHQNEGRAVFEGQVSLENNGGFAMVRSRFQPIAIEAYQRVLIDLRGDGKRYQFRVKSSFGERQAYVQYFETSGERQTVSIRLADLYPTFRGRRLEMPNFPARQLSEIAFLIGNKRAESFRLELYRIELQ